MHFDGLALSPDGQQIELMRQLVLLHGHLRQADSQQMTVTVENRLDGKAPKVRLSTAAARRRSVGSQRTGLPSMPAAKLDGYPVRQLQDVKDSHTCGAGWP